jgi:hypothetical protein
MRQKTQSHRNQGSIDKKIRFFLQSLRHISRWVRVVQKTRSKNSHAWAPLRKDFVMARMSNKKTVILAGPIPNYDRGIICLCRKWSIWGARNRVSPIICKLVNTEWWFRGHERIIKHAHAHTHTPCTYLNSHTKHLLALSQTTHLLTLTHRSLTHTHTPVTYSHSHNKHLLTHQALTITHTPSTNSYSHIPSAYSHSHTKHLLTHTPSTYSHSHTGHLLTLTHQTFT